jgi:uncharacterized membrane protein YeaQ/YmgE (transglycosylase-associated protein family)
MHIISMLIVGLIVGVLAKVLTPGKQSSSILLTILLGIVGSVAAGFIGRAIGWYHTPGDGPGLIASVLGAMLLLAILHWSTRGRVSL